MKVWVVNGCLSRISTGKEPSKLLSRLGSSDLGPETNMFMTAFAGSLLGADSYKFFIFVTPEYINAEPWFLCTAFGGSSLRSDVGMREGTGFSITVPKAEKVS
jgi:hypothetical protein